MASAAFPNIEQLVKTIKNDGFIFLEGGGKGLQAVEFEKKQFPITTSEGIDFLEAHTFNDPRITEILESVFEWSCLGMYTVIHPFPGCAHSFFAGKTDLQGLMVQIWGCGSTAIYYQNSHYLPLKPSGTHDGMFEIPHAQLALGGSNPITMIMKEEGLVVLDPRLGFTVFNGFAVTFVFAIRDLVNKWAKMRLPYSLELDKKVAGINGLSQKIGTNFIFQE